MKRPNIQKNPVESDGIVLSCAGKSSQVRINPASIHPYDKREDYICHTFELQDEEYEFTEYQMIYHVLPVERIL